MTRDSWLVTRHHYAYHEMLSGEWGAAIYYEAIASDPCAMWLTDEFIEPEWPTDSNFTTEYYNVWNDPNNPVWDDPNFSGTGNDTGQSDINNAEVRVTIDYEMVDLGEQGPNGEGGSPLAFRTADGKSAFVRSERYILLQTYTITNIRQDANVTGLEFYQMLHGHPANEYYDAVYSVYETFDYNDPLKDYVPYNPVHNTTGNFRCDISQWNNPNDPNATRDHQDWMGFSSTVEPNVVDDGNGYIDDIYGWDFDCKFCINCYNMCVAE